MAYCPRCSRNVNPMEDEYVLALLSYMLEDYKLRPHMGDQLVDKVCVAITAYIRGRERRYWEVK